MRHLLSVLLATLATATCVCGQSAPGHTFRILFLDRPADAPVELYLFDGASSQKVELPRMNLSPVYKLRPGALKLSLLPAPADDPKNIPAGAPSATVPENQTDFYLLVASDRNNKVAPVTLRVVNANDDQLGRGQMLWFNLTDKAVAGTVGREKVALKPGARELVKEPRGGKGDYLVDLYFRVEGDDFVHPLCETSWRHDPRSRSLVFLISEGNRRAPRVFAFYDYREARESKAGE